MSQSDIDWVINAISADLTRYNKKLEEVSAWLLGTCNSAEAAIVKFDLDVESDYLMSDLLDLNVEPCRGCGWWFESGELARGIPEDSDGYCEDCWKDE